MTNIHNNVLILHVMCIRCRAYYTIRCHCDTQNNGDSCSLAVPFFSACCFLPVQWNALLHSDLNSWSCSRYWVQVSVSPLLNPPLSASLQPCGCLYNRTHWIIIWLSHSGSLEVRVCLFHLSVWSDLQPRIAQNVCGKVENGGGQADAARVLR